MVGGRFVNWMLFLTQQCSIKNTDEVGYKSGHQHASEHKNEKGHNHKDDFDTYRWNLCPSCKVGNLLLFSDSAPIDKFYLTPIDMLCYSRVHKSSDSFFSKILEKPSIVQKKMIPHINGLHFSMRWSKKKNSKWPT